MVKTKEELIKGLYDLLEETQINLDEEDLYEASADRYKNFWFTVMKIRSMSFQEAARLRQREDLKTGKNLQS